MSIEHVPLLQIERDLHDIPRGMERFQAYLQTLVNETGDDVRYAPLVAMNPMGREHVSERLDELITLDAETIAVEAISEALTEAGGIRTHFQHGWVVMDDVRGGWTNRTVNDAALRFGGEPSAKRPWLTSVWWVSEIPSPEKLRQVIRAIVYRLFYLQQHGVPKTLRQIMMQEGTVAAFAGLTAQYDEEELDYSRQVLEPYLETTDYGVLIAALYGDAAARSLGYEPLGLSENAGLDVALANTLAIGGTVK